MEITRFRDRIDFDKYINYIAIVYAFLLPISRAGISLLTATLFLLWLLDKDLKTRVKSIISNKVIFAILIFFSFSLLSLLWSSNIPEGWKFLRTYWYLLPVFAFATHIRHEALIKIISAFLFGMLISEILSYGIFFEIWQWKNVPPTDPTPFMNHLQYTMFLAFAALLLLNRFFFETNTKWKIFYFIYFLTVTSNLFLNGGRTGQLAFVVSIFIAGFLNIKNKLLAFSSMLVLVSAILFTAYNISPVFQDRIALAEHETKILSNESDNQYKGSMGKRLGAWIVGYEIFKENPLVGTGIGDEMDALRYKIKHDMPEMMDAYTIVHYHNNYVTYLVQIGLIGLFLYLNIIYQVLRLPIQDRELSNIRYIFIAVFSTASLVEQMFSAQFPLALFTLFVGIFISATYSTGSTK